MSYTQIADDNAAAASERAVATRRQSDAVQNGQVERVTYQERTIEIPRIDHAALGRPTDKQYERNFASVQTRLQKIGVSTATVVSFLPIPLTSVSTLEPLRKATIKPPKDTETYSTYVFDEAFIEPARMGADSPLLAFEHHPIELAQEFSSINPKGVFTFIGVPSDVEDPAWRAKISEEPQHGGKTYGQAIDECERQAIEWMQEQLRHGNANDRLKVGCTEPQKASARRLRVLGRIETFPSWVEKQVDVNQKIPQCPKCQRPSQVNAAQCTNDNCGFIIDPRRAYEIQAIDEGHESLERLTRAEVTEMGISDYVAETVDEKRSRLSMGLPKPLSIAAARLKDAQDEDEDRRRREASESLGRAAAAAAAGKKE